MFLAQVIVSNFSRIYHQNQRADKRRAQKVRRPIIIHHCAINPPMILWRTSMCFCCPESAACPDPDCQGNKWSCFCRKKTRCWSSTGRSGNYHCHHHRHHHRQHHRKHHWQHHRHHHRHHYRQHHRHHYSHQRRSQRLSWLIWWRERTFSVFWPQDCDGWVFPAEFAKIDLHWLSVRRELRK